MARRKYGPVLSWPTKANCLQSFLQANVDSDLSFSGRLNYRWNSALVTKLSMQLGAMGTAFSMENHYAGSDFSASLKTLNASMLTGSITGMVMASYLQAVTPKLSLGVDTVWSRPDEVQPPDMVLAYAARYNAENWVASAHLLATGALEAAYWRKVTDKVEAGISLNLAMAGASPMAGPMMAAKKEGTVTLGAKYGYRTSVFRAQVDSTGKVACLLEKHIMPAIAITYSGELDHKTVRLPFCRDEPLMLPPEANQAGPRRYVRVGEPRAPRGSRGSRKGRTAAETFDSLLDVPCHVLSLFYAMVASPRSVSLTQPLCFDVYQQDLKRTSRERFVRLIGEHESALFL